MPGYYYVMYVECQCMGWMRWGPPRLERQYGLFFDDEGFVITPPWCWDYRIVRTIYFYL